MASLPASRAEIEFLGEPRYGEYSFVLDSPQPVSTTPRVTLTAFPSRPPPAFITKAGKNNFSTPPRPTASVTRRITLDRFPPGSPLTKLQGFIPPPPKSTGGPNSFPTASPNPVTSASPDPTMRFPGSATETPRNPIPFTIGQELCFGTDNPHKKRADEDEESLTTNLIDYIQYVISRFDDDRCPSKNLIEPAVAIARAGEEAGAEKRSAPLVKRQPQTLEELVALVVNIYNGCPTEGYRTKRAFRPIDLDEFKHRRPYGWTGPYTLLGA